jgi:hypothetical protein
MEQKTLVGLNLLRLYFLATDISIFIDCQCFFFFFEIITTYGAIDRLHLQHALRHEMSLPLKHRDCWFESNSKRVRLCLFCVCVVLCKLRPCDITHSLSEGS